jgi:hypothetical protein
MRNLGDSKQQQAESEKRQSECTERTESAHRGAVQRRRRALHADRRRGRVEAAPALGAPRAHCARCA